MSPDDVKNISRDRLSAFREYLLHFVTSKLCALSLSFSRSMTYSLYKIKNSRALHQTFASQLETLEGLIAQIDPDRDVENIVEKPKERESTSDDEVKEDDLPKETEEKPLTLQKRRSQRYSLSRELSQVEMHVLSITLCRDVEMMTMILRSWAQLGCIHT